MKSDLALIVLAFFLFAVVGYFVFTATIRKQFNETPTETINSASIWEKQRDHAEKTKLKQKEMMENLRQQMQHQGY